MSKTTCQHCSHKFEYERKDVEGAHYVMCGDSTDPAAVDILMGGVQADMVFTDPPYNVNYSGGGKKTSNKILNDNMSDDSFQTFLNDVFENLARVTKPEAGVYSCYARRGRPNTCEHCGFVSDERKALDWANKSQQYKRELDDWLRLCKPCHKRYDMRVT